ncbi:MAG TPA: RDD family protein [Bryobacteraceae bacterium]|jgi:uncharacterized RDD family membrane protein YckC|nr:RDD family protein [Bryobacteraceae bacterium]
MSAAPTPEILYCTQCGRPQSADDLAHFGVVLICPDCKKAYVQRLREGVAPTATASYGGFWIRFVAWLIDGIILMVVGSIVQFALLGSLIQFRQPQRGASPDVVFGAMLGMVGLVFLVDMVIGCSYEAFFVSSGLCATPGKLALELKVVRPNGARLGLGRAVGRYFAKRLNLLTGGIGYIMAGFDSERRGLHDLICDTRVVRRQS